MAGDLLTLPLRIGVWSTRMALRTAEGIAERAVLGAVQVVSVFTKNDSTSTAPAPEPQTGRESRRERSTAPRERTSPSRPATSPSPEATPHAPETTPPASRPEPVDGDTAPIVSAPLPEDEPARVPEPSHVSEEPELVLEEAEPGAEEGAGATVRIDPPWQGYDGMTARDVIARLSDASAAEIAAVQLYETSKRGRQSVLEAVARQLKAANGQG